MARTKHIEQCLFHPAGAEWRWLLLCLLTAVAILLLLGQSTPVQASDPEPQYVTSSNGADTDCDHTHGLLGGHCHVTVVCSSYAQIETGAVTYDEMTNAHPRPMAEGARVTQSPRPNLQPPKHSSQA